MKLGILAGCDCCSVAQFQLCLSLCDPVDCSLPGLSVPHHLWKFAQVHSILSVMPSSYLILWCPLLFLPSIFPSIRDFSNESAVRIRWPKYWSLFQHQYFQWVFRVDFPYNWLVWSPCCPRDFQESSSAPQFKGINSLAFCLLYGTGLTTIHDCWDAM